VRRRRDLPPVLQDLGRQFHAAAKQEMAPRRRRARGWRRALLVAVAAAILVAGVAGAARLIGVGDSVKDTKDIPSRLRPNGRPEIAVRTADPDGGPAWAAAAYVAAGGQDCVVAGRERGGVIGLQLSRDEFRPLEPRTFGACGRLDRSRLVFSVSRPRDMFDRSIVYGRARAGVHAVQMTVEGDRRRVPVGSAGTFLAVYEGPLRLQDVAVAPAD
jgi:hypothetical protein